MAYQTPGKKFGEIDNHTIYQFNNYFRNASGNFYLSVPDDYVENYQLFLRFPNKDLKDVPAKEIIEDFKKMNDLLQGINKENAIYILPDISPNELEEASKENDNKKFNEILNKLKLMIPVAYQALTGYNTAKKSIEQVIEFVKKTESDRKFVDWLEINMPNFIHGITYEELKKQYYERTKYANIFDKPLEEKNPDESIPKINSENGTYEQTKTNAKVKVKKLTPRSNNYGFSNVFKIVFLLATIVIAGIIIANMML